MGRTLVPCGQPGDVVVVLPPAVEVVTGTVLDEVLDVVLVVVVDEYTTFLPNSTARAVIHVALVR